MCDESSHGDERSTFRKKKKPAGLEPERVGLIVMVFHAERVLTVFAFRIHPLDDQQHQRSLFTSTEMVMRARLDHQIIFVMVGLTPETNGTRKANETFALATMKVPRGPAMRWQDLQEPPVALLAASAEIERIGRRRKRRAWRIEDLQGTGAHAKPDRLFEKRYRNRYKTTKLRSSPRMKLPRQRDELERVLIWDCFHVRIPENVSGSRNHRDRGTPTLHNPSFLAESSMNRKTARGNERKDAR